MVFFLEQRVVTSFMFLELSDGRIKKVKTKFWAISGWQMAVCLRSVIAKRLCACHLSLSALTAGLAKLPWRSTAKREAESVSPSPSSTKPPHSKSDYSASPWRQLSTGYPTAPG